MCFGVAKNHCNVHNSLLAKTDRSVGASANSSPVRVDTHIGVAGDVQVLAHTNDRLKNVQQFQQLSERHTVASALVPTSPLCNHLEPTSETRRSLGLRKVVKRHQCKIHPNYVRPWCILGGFLSFPLLKYKLKRYFLKTCFTWCCNLRDVASGFLDYHLNFFLRNIMEWNQYVQVQQKVSGARLREVRIIFILCGCQHK